MDFHDFWRVPSAWRIGRGGVKRTFAKNDIFLPSPDLIFDKKLMILSDLFIPQTVKTRSQTGLENMTFFGVPFFQDFCDLGSPLRGGRPPLAGAIFAKSLQFFGSGGQICSCNPWANFNDFLVIFPQTALS